MYYGRRKGNWTIRVPLTGSFIAFQLTFLNIPNFKQKSVTKMPAELSAFNLSFLVLRRNLLNV